MEAPIDIKNEVQWIKPTEFELEQQAIIEHQEEQKYIKDLFIQSHEDFEAAEILKGSQCHAQAILLFQQANEKSLKALWFKRGELKS